MITDRIRRHEVLLPINHNFNKICDIIGYFLNQNTRKLKFCFASSEKKSHLSALVMARTQFSSNYLGMTRAVLLNFSISIGNSVISSDIWHKYQE